MQARSLLFPFLGAKVDIFSLNPDAKPVAGELVFLGHGGYGSVSRPTMHDTIHWSMQIETNPVHFYYNTLFPYLVRALRAVAAVAGSLASNMVLVPNVEYGIQCVLNSIPVQDGDEWVGFDFAYTAVATSMSFYATKRDASYAQITTSWPITTESLLSDLRLYLDAHPRTTLLCFEHITSPTAILMPLQDIINLCRQRNILTLVDGAHGIGQVEIQLDEWQPDFYVSNMHKWLCTSRPAAFLCTQHNYLDIQLAHQDYIHPLVITWGHGLGFQAEFIWQGTGDYSPYLSIPTAIRTFEWLGGLQPVMQRNADMITWAGEYLSSAWETDTLVQREMSAPAMISVRIPKRNVSLKPSINCIDDSCSFSTLHDQLLKVHGIEIPVFTHMNQQYLRVSIHVYNTKEDVIKLATAVLKLQGISDD